MINVLGGSMARRNRDTSTPISRRRNYNKSVDKVFFDFLDEYYKTVDLSKILKVDLNDLDKETDSQKQEDPNRFDKNI